MTEWRHGCKILLWHKKAVNKEEISKWWCHYWIVLIIWKTLKLQKRAKSLFPLLVTKHFLVWQTKHFEKLLSLQLLESWQLFSSLCFFLTSFSNPYHRNFVTLVYFVYLIQSAILNAQSSNGTFITYYKATRPYL